MWSIWIACVARLFCSSSHPPQGFANGPLMSGKYNVGTPNVFHRPIANEPSAIADVVVGISHVMLLFEIEPLPLNQPTARNAMPFGLLSALAAPATSVAASSVTTSVPRPMIPNSLHPAPPAPTPARIRGGSRSPELRARR